MYKDTLCACGLSAPECWASVHNSCHSETVATWPIRKMRHWFCHNASNSSIQCTTGQPLDSHLIERK